MRRHLDLIRLILLEVEKNDTYAQTLDVTAEGYSPEEISYHVMLLCEAGFVTAGQAQDAGGQLRWYPRSLTWTGHEFLDATRNARVWHQLRAKLKDQGMEAPLTVVQQLASKLVAQALGLAD